MTPTSSSEASASDSVASPNDHNCASVDRSFLLQKETWAWTDRCKSLSKIYFTQPWHERVSIVDGVKEPSKVTC